MQEQTTIALGQAIRHEWQLDWAKLTVNHGAFGATPACVLAAQTQWRDRMEAQLSMFMRRVLPDAMRASAEALGRFLGGEGQDIAFVDNATTGCNAVLRSLDLKEGDEIVLHSQAYGAVLNTVRYVARRSGARIVDVDLPFPGTDIAAFTARFAAARASSMSIYPSPAPILQPSPSASLRRSGRVRGSPSSITSPRRARCCCR
jgi:isopenicillin-N epimerase